MKDPALSIADKVANTARSRQNATAKANGISASDMAEHSHLGQSRHFGADATPKNPAGKSVPQRDGLAKIAGAMSKRFIGG